MWISSRRSGDKTGRYHALGRDGRWNNGYVVYIFVSLETANRFMWVRRNNIWKRACYLHKMNGGKKLFTFQAADLGFFEKEGLYLFTDLDNGLVELEREG